jgi:hypothetical protein
MGSPAKREAFELWKAQDSLITFHSLLGLVILVVLRCPAVRMVYQPLLLCLHLDSRCAARWYSPSGTLIVGVLGLRFPGGDIAKNEQ